MKYFLVEVVKRFAVYPLKAQLTMREKLVKGIFKDNVKVIREVEEQELKTVMKYAIVKEEEKEAETKKVVGDEIIADEVIVDKIEDTVDIENLLILIGGVSSIEGLKQFDYENPELKEAIDNKRVELTNEIAPETVETTPKEETITEEEKVAETVENDVNNDETIVPEVLNDGLDALEQPELLKMAIALGLNKPSNTGKANLIQSIRNKNLETK